VAPAIDYLTSLGVTAINLSFAGVHPEGSAGDPVTAAAIENAQNAGILVVAAMGNSGVSSSSIYPACYPGVLGVGATDNQGAMADFSNTGPCVDVVAPGVAILSTTNPQLDGTTDTRYARHSGTSMSASHVAGTASLVKAFDPTLRGTEIADRITGSATDLGPPGRDDQYGYGFLNAECAVNPAAQDCPGRQ
jgi:subtilisin family serine protease